MLGGCKTCNARWYFDERTKDIAPADSCNKGFIASRNLVLIFSILNLSIGGGFITSQR
tara:strand:+ start:1754 stop:1927 length:174 start_codon:yes stop_codon:yes gene_type:complete